MTFPYQPSKVIVTWGGIPILGMDADSIVMCEYSVDAIEMLIGVKGEAAMTVIEDKSGKATCSLLQGSPTNALLTAQCAQSRPRGAPLIMRPFIVTNLGGADLAVGPQAAILKVPPLTFKRGQESREWVWLIPEWKKLIVGGTL